MANVAGGSVALNHKAEIIERIANGEPLTSIASSLGYAGHSGIVERLGNDPDYQRALVSGVHGKLEKREKELESAVDNVTVTRADRLLGHARWYAERVARDQFGVKPDASQQPIQVIVQVFDKPEEKPVVAVQGKDLT